MSPSKHGHSHNNHSHSHSHNHSHSHGNHSATLDRLSNHSHDSHGHSHGENKFCGCFHFSNAARLSSMLVMTSSFFLLELIVGHFTNSVSMTADAFHMLSDVLALVIGLVSTILSKKKTNKNTYGWVRAEILGALINSVFLISLCFSIFIEAIERFVFQENIKQPHLLLYVGIAGFTINLIGLFIFGHGHSHGISSTNSEIIHDGEEAIEEMMELIQHDIQPDGINSLPVSNQPVEATPANMPQNKVNANKKKTEKKARCSILSKEANMNMRAVFLHVLADALGSVAVIISAIINIFHEELKLKSIVSFIDPFLSLLLIALILFSTIPLVKESALILLQTAPKEINVNLLKKELTEKIPGVISVHEMHVWMLSPNKFIATAHIACESSNQYMDIARQVKKIFHKYRIHSTTIQPEFKDHLDEILDEECKLECQRACSQNTCCGSESTKKTTYLKPNRSKPNLNTTNESMNGQSIPTGPSITEEHETANKTSSGDVVINLDNK